MKGSRHNNLLRKRLKTIYTYFLSKNIPFKKTHQASTIGSLKFEEFRIPFAVHYGTLRKVISYSLSLTHTHYPLTSYYASDTCK